MYANNTPAHNAERDADAIADAAVRADLDELRAVASGRRDPSNPFARAAAAGLLAGTGLDAATARRVGPYVAELLGLLAAR